MHRILIVEDDPTIARELKEELTHWGFEVLVIQEFHDVLKEVQAAKPQLVLMDIKLPVHNGFHWTQEIRKSSQVPILFLSSRSDNIDIVTAIQMGADDFIPKPFSMSVAVAKIQAILRRTYDFGQQELRYTYGGVTLRPEEMVVDYEGAREALTRTECRILLSLFEHKGTWVSRETLCMNLWDSDEFIDDNTLSVNLSRLRRKLLNLGLEGFIDTKKGVGYGIGLE
ncbi:hypothetical protein ABB02_00011 [Clostridiaceae bacterium JG1575]|nr:hypothetical protein ABB02_00011 [Clostridiaceae bacterium JG1575]